MTTRSTVHDSALDGKLLMSTDIVPGESGHPRYTARSVTTTD